MRARPARPERLLDTGMEVETPEHVSFRYQVAGPARRALAYLVDLLVRGAAALAALAVAAIAGAGGDEQGLEVGIGVWLVVYFAIEWLYFVVLELAMAGQSLGKRALRLRVVKEDGTPVAAGDSILRNLLRAADFLPAGYALGVVVMGRDHGFRRLGDLAAGTLVVHEGHGRLAAPIDVSTLPAAAAGVQADLTAGEVHALELFVRRRASLSAPRWRELAAILAPVLARRMGVTYDDPALFLAGLYRRSREVAP